LDINEVAAMALPRSSPTKLASSLILVAVLLLTHRCAAEEDIMLDQKIELIWGASHTYFFMDGDTETLALSLDEQKGSCFRSLDMYLFSRIDVDIKLVEGNSAGTVATVYVRSPFLCLPVIPVPFIFLSFYIQRAGWSRDPRSSTDQCMLVVYVE
jgi:hypothetical protein